MRTFFLICGLLGAAVLALQLVLGIAGLEHGGDVDHPGGDALHGGLDLLSVRALAAGLAAFGAGGMLGIQSPFGVVGGLVVGTAFGLGAAAGVAYLMRSMLRLESDGTMRLENAIGASARVYLTIPPERAGAGKVHVVVQGRMVEVTAVTAHERPLPTGATVVIIDVAGSDVVEVAPESAILPTEVPNAVL